MKYKKLQLRIIVFAIALSLSSNPVTTLGHSGRTDANGGHRDNKNVSGLGSYHYHHGYSAHLHPNGVCPYDVNESTESNSGGSSGNSNEGSNDTSEQDKEVSRSDGYTAGYNDGKNGNSNSPNISGTKYPEEFKVGYSQGYDKGLAEFNAAKAIEMKKAKSDGYTSGYKDGKNENGSNPYATTSKYIEEYKSGYLEGYKKGGDDLKAEKESVTKSANEDGYKDGYNGTPTKKENYTGSQKDLYIRNYDLAYNDGLYKRNQEILDIQIQARLLGRDDGYNQVLRNNLGYEGRYVEEYRVAYEEGFENGKSQLERDNVRKKAESSGYKDGYEGKPNLKYEYKGNYMHEYQSSYNMAYDTGLAKRNQEINEIETIAHELGRQDGYNKIKKEVFDYTGEYLEEYKTAYNKGIIDGQKQLEDEILTASKNAYLAGVQGIQLDTSKYKHEDVKKAALDSFNKGKVIFTKVFLHVPTIGQPLEAFDKYAFEKSNIKLGICDITDRTIVAINNTKNRSVTDIILYINNINGSALEKKIAEKIVNNFFSSEILNSYKTIKTYKTTDKKYIYEVKKLKRIKKLNKYMPRNMYLVTIYEGNLVKEIRIMAKESKYIRRLYKIYD